MKRLPLDLEAWVAARRRFRLSHAQIQMARELGMNPIKLGKIANADQEAWKLPLPLFIEQLYLERFGRPNPEEVLSVEERFQRQEAKKAAKKEAKRQAREAAARG